MTGNYSLSLRRTRCFETIDVLVDEKLVGCIQQVDATAGMTGTRYPRDLWLVWVGDPDKAGTGHNRALPKEEAIRHILEAAQQ